MWYQEPLHAATWLHHRRRGVCQSVVLLARMPIPGKQAVGTTMRRGPSTVNPSTRTVLVITADSKPGMTGRSMVCRLQVPNGSLVASDTTGTAIQQTQAQMQMDHPQLDGHRVRALLNMNLLSRGHQRGRTTGTTDCSFRIRAACR